MSGGMKRMIVNTRERAISNDLNRLQAFKDSDVCELFRLQCGCSSNSLTTTGSIDETSHDAVIDNGLLVTPVAGTLSMLVSAGTMFAWKDSATGDDNHWTFIRSEGVSVLGTLTIAAGAGGTRIDLVECRCVDATTETSNRDIFDPATGLFSPASVPKVAASMLEFQVKPGTPGGGYGGNTVGWVPLAIISVPAAATTIDGCDLWDVRRLWKALHSKPFASQRDTTIVKRCMFQAMPSSSGSPIPSWDWIALNLQGLVEQECGETAAQGYLSETDIDLYTSTGVSSVWEPGLTFVSHKPWFLWALTPFGLPQWRKYTRTGARKPYGYPGVLCLSSTGSDLQGNPTTSIALPAATGLGGSATAGSLVAHGLCATVPTFGATPMPRPACADGQWVYVKNVVAGDCSCAAISGAFFPVIPSSLSGQCLFMILLPNTYFPASARAIRVTVYREIFITVISEGAQEVATPIVLDGLSGTPVELGTTISGIATRSGSYVSRTTFEIPLLREMSLMTTSFGVNLSVSHDLAFAATHTSTWAEIVAWRMTP